MKEISLGRSLTKMCSKRGEKEHANKLQCHNNVDRFIKLSRKFFLTSNDFFTSKSSGKWMRTKQQNWA